MEILNMVPVTRLPIWTGLSIVIGMISLIALMFELADFRIRILRSCVLAVILVACLLTTIFAPREQKTGQIKYTVEITDNGQYKKLIDEGYTFERVYRDRDIYEICGEPLEEQGGSACLTEN